MTKGQSYVYGIGRYSVVVADIFSGEQARKGYGVVNEDTGVVEFETTMLYNAIQAAQQSEQLVTELMSGKATSWTEALAAEGKPLETA